MEIENTIEDQILSTPASREIQDSINQILTEDKSQEKEVEEEEEEEEEEEGETQEAIAICNADSESGTCNYCIEFKTM
jgi:hypothetical protein